MQFIGGIGGRQCFQKLFQDFSGGPVVKTPHFQGRGCNPQLGNKDPICHMAWPKKKVPRATEYSYVKKYSYFIPPAEINSRSKFERETNASRRKEKKSISESMNHTGKPLIRQC